MPVTISDSAAAALRQLQAEFPREFKAGLKTLGASVRKRVRTELQSGTVPGESWPALHPLTLALRRKRGGPGSRGRKFGGKLGALLRDQMNESRTSMRVGWLDDMTPGITTNAILFQSAERRTFSPREHRLLRVMKLQQEREKNRPARNVINAEAQAPVTSEDAVRIVTGAIRAMVARNIARAKR